MRRTILLVVAGLMLAASQLGSVASATTTRIPTSGFETCAVANPGHPWMADGVAHVRGEVFECTMVPDVPGDPGAPYMAGTETVVINYNLDTATGSGGLWGTFHSDLAAFAPEGGFEGTWNGTFSSFAWSGKLVGKGYGALQGWQVRLDIQPTTATSDTLSGFVFDPGI